VPKQPDIGSKSSDIQHFITTHSVSNSLYEKLSRKAVLCCLLSNVIHIESTL